MTDCWGCTNSKRTGLGGYVQDGCMQCMAREIANGPNAHKREADGGAAVNAEMRAAWPNAADLKRGKAMVWAEILKREATECE